MELTIHIGPHKTGTTAIQTAFAKAAGTLRRQGFLYPKTNWLFPAQHRLAFALKGRVMSTGDRLEVGHELETLGQALDRFPGNRALISSEEFFACPPEAIARLRDHIGPARIVCFLRRPDDFLISCYNQKIKQPGNGFSPPIRRFLNDPQKIAPEFHYHSCVSAWADAFGDAAIHLEIYEAAPPLARLREILGLQDQPTAPPGRPNSSVPGPVAEIMRHAKAIGMADDRQRTLFGRAQKIYRDYPPFFVSETDRNKIISAAETDNDALFRRFGKSNPYRVPLSDPTSAPRDHNLNHQDLLHLIDSLL